MPAVDQNTIDEVMKRVNEDVTLVGPRDVDTIIEYYHNTLARYNAGEKPTKRTSKALDLESTPHIQLQSLGLGKPKASTFTFRKPQI